MSLVSVVPKITLRGLDYQKLLERYYQGEFANAVIPRLQLHIDPIRDFLNPVYDEEVSNNIFSVKNQRETIICMTSNCRAYNDFRRGALTQEKSSVLTCFWCLRQFTHPNEPTVVELEQYHYHNQGFDGTFFIFYTLDIYCSIGCNLAGIRRELKCQGENVQIYKNAESYTRLYHNLRYPDSQVVVKPAADFRLLLCNGGCLTDEEWSDQKFDYRPVANLIKVPTKIVYQQFLKNKT